MEGEMAPAMKVNIEQVVPVVERKPEEDSSDLNGIGASEPHVDVAVSRKSEPTLLPEMWAKIFEDLLSADLETVINTCPEWNKLLSFQKPPFLFPKVLACMRGWLPKNDLLAFRLINKGCKAGVDSAHPENLSRIVERLEADRKSEDRRREIQSQIQLYEEFLVEADYHIGAREPNIAAMWDRRRDDYNYALIILRENLQNIN